MTKVRIEIDVDGPPKLVKQIITNQGSSIGNMVASRAKNMTPVGSVSRPVYRRGRYAGSSWTSRSPGRLRATVKGFKARYTSKGMISVVTAGSNDAFYAFWTHQGIKSRGLKGKFYLKKAAKAIQNQIKSKIEAAIRSGLK